MFNLIKIQKKNLSVKDLQGYLYNEFERVQKLQEELAKVKSENECLQEDLKQRQSAYVLVEEIKSRCEALNNRLHDSEKIIGRKDKEITDLRARNAELTIQNRQFKSDVNSALSNAKAQLESEHEKVIAKLVSEKSQLLDANKQLNNDLIEKEKEIIPRIQKNYLESIINKINSMGSRSGKQMILEMLKGDANYELQL